MKSVGNKYIIIGVAAGLCIAVALGWAARRLTGAAAIPDYSGGFFPITFATRDKRLQAELVAVYKDKGLPLQLVEKYDDRSRMPMTLEQFYKSMPKEVHEFNNMAWELRKALEEFYSLKGWSYDSKKICLEKILEFVAAKRDMVENFRRKSQAISRATEFIRGRRVALVPDDFAQVHELADLTLRTNEYYSLVCLPAMMDGNFEPFERLVEYEEGLFEFSPLLYFFMPASKYATGFCHKLPAVGEALRQLPRARRDRFVELATRWVETGKRAPRLEIEAARIFLMAWSESDRSEEMMWWRTRVKYYCYFRRGGSSKLWDDLLTSMLVDFNPLYIPERVLEDIKTFFEPVNDHMDAEEQRSLAEYNETLSSKAGTDIPSNCILRRDDLFYFDGCWHESLVNDVFARALLKVLSGEEKEITYKEKGASAARKVIWIEDGKLLMRFDGLEDFDLALE